LGGLLIGISWAALLGIAYLKGPAEIIPRRLLGLVAALVIVTASGWHVSERHEKDLVFYAPRHAVKTVSSAFWHADGWRSLPVWLIDMEGKPEQPLTVQWTGPPDMLARYLIGKGWQWPPSLSLKSFLGMFATDTPVQELPVLPRLHDGRAERLLLFHTDRDKRLVLRLWPTDINITAADTPPFLRDSGGTGSLSIGGLGHLDKRYGRI